MARRALASAVVVAIAGAVACGSFGEAVPTDAGTMSTSEDGGADAVSDGSGADPDALVVRDGAVPLPGRRCAVGSAFTTAPTTVAVGAFGVEAVRFDSSQKIAYVSLCPVAGPKTECDLWLGSVTQTGIVPTTRYGVSAVSEYDSHPMPSFDGTYFVFASDRGGKPKIFGAAGTNGVFDTGATVLSIPTKPNASADANEPYLLANGTLYFSAAPSASTDYDLFRSDGKVPMFVAGRLLTNVTPSVDVAPVVAEDELEMFWASDVSDPNGKGGLDVWTGTRTAADAPYAYGKGNKVVPGLSTPEVDYPTWLSPDGCDLYLIHKANGTTPGELRVAHRN